MAEEKFCVYRGKAKIGDAKWDWCNFYNSRIGDVNCETCDISNKSEKVWDIKKMPII